MLCNKHRQQDPGRAAWNCLAPFQFCQACGCEGVVGMVLASRGAHHGNIRSASWVACQKLSFSGESLASQRSEVELRLWRASRMYSSTSSTTAAPGAGDTALTAPPSAPSGPPAEEVGVDNAYDTPRSSSQIRLASATAEPPPLRVGGAGLSDRNPLRVNVTVYHRLSPCATPANCCCYRGCGGRVGCRKCPWWWRC